MILPGLSGAYLLLVLGQYRTIVDAIAQATEAIRAGAWGEVGEALHVFIPVGIGVVVGVVGVSNLVKLLLEKLQRATLGFLLGLVLGAVIGLWPFQTPVKPEVGDVIRGVQITSVDMLDELEPRHYPRIAVAPTGQQVVFGLGLVLVGFGVSWGISRLGSQEKRQQPL